MNKKLSGAQLVVVDIKTIGRNKFPFVENINKRYIKYIDFFPCEYLPGITGNVGVDDTQDMYITISNEQGNVERIKELPLERLNYKETMGIRQEIGAKISLDKTFVICQNSAMVGKKAAFVFWYDLPEFSRKSETDVLSIDAISVDLTNVIRYNQLPDSDRMTGKRFRRILVSTPTVTPDYKAGVAAENLQNLYLTLKKGSYNVVEDLPLELLYQNQMLEKTEFANIIFDFQSSYITVGGAGSIPTPSDYIGKSVFLNMEYENK